MEEDRAVVDERDRALTKEEILEQSRKENARGDEREQEILKKGINIALMAGLVVLFIVYLVNAVVLERNSYELVAIVFVINGINSIWQGVFGKRLKRAFLAIGIIELAISVAFIVLWILTLVK